MKKETENRKKEEKKRKKGKKEIQESPQIKGEVNILRGKNTSTSKILFDVILFSPPPLYHFKNPFQNHCESFLNSFWTIL
jgi:hypothetical protein